MPYCKNDMKNAFYRVKNVVVESKCQTLKRIPQVFPSFLESSAMWYFPFRCSSNKTPKNLIYCTLKMCFLPILIEMLGGIELEDEWNIINWFYLYSMRVCLHEAIFFHALALA